MKNSIKNNYVSEDFEIDGTVLVEYKGKGPDVVIPNFITRVSATVEDRYGECYSAFFPGTVNCVKSITVPKSLTYIDGWTFYWCNNLEHITVDGQNEAYYSEGNCIIERSGNTLVTACKNSVIPSDIKCIADHALVHCYGTHLTYNGTKRQWSSIDKHVDWNKSNRDCVIHCTDGDFTVDDAPFIIQNTLLWLYKGHSARVVIPDNVTRILADPWEGMYCFEFCGFIKSITVPKSLVGIDGNTFYGCFDLEEIIVDSQNTKYYSQGNCLIEKASKKLVAGCKTSVIPDDVKIIGFNSFYGCKNMTGITIPSSLTSIEAGAFCGCESLTNITIPNSVTAIGNSAFRYCTGLTSITIGNGVTSIGVNAFHGCSRLTSVYYKGTATDWINLFVDGNGDLASATVYYYSALQPTKRGNYWHYDTDGVTPVKW